MAKGKQIKPKKRPDYTVIVTIIPVRREDDPVRFEQCQKVRRMLVAKAIESEAMQKSA